VAVYQVTNRYVHEMTGYTKVYIRLNYNIWHGFGPRGPDIASLLCTLPARLIFVRIL
jgi:hypothetical protein